MDSPASHRLRRGRFSEPGRLYLLTSVTRNRSPFFADFHAARAICAQFRQAQQEGAARTLAWVVMPDHVHWLIELRQATLSRLMCRFKSRSRCALYKAGMLQGKLWQPGYHDHALRREENVCAVARDVVANPLRAGLVKKLGDYPHWDAVWL
ncbi:transposase [Pseudomonas sp. JQ170]|uniref:REP-associated tyrosine transposase n=1 Tax=unclassified Pseudomonas TaxID=196821 RepID=UPI00265305DA|nr:MULTISPECIES: transposase [unclassified Pseudomonas]MDN7143315.1 transposase [Pseudomonas sp. JQ170]WRO75764.1 transposase [Pseudomonas sp. 170C]